MKEIQDKLFKLQDKKYQNLQINILPTVNPNTIIGIMKKNNPQNTNIAIRSIGIKNKPVINALPVINNTLIPANTSFKHNANITITKNNNNILSTSFSFNSLKNFHVCNFIIA